MILARLSAIYHSGDRQNINCILADITAVVSSEVRRNYYKIKNNAVRSACFLPLLAFHTSSSTQVVLFETNLLYPRGLLPSLLTETLK